jgi:hypothetical protein
VCVCEVVRGEARDRLHVCVREREREEEERERQAHDRLTVSYVGHPSCRAPLYFPIGNSSITTSYVTEISFQFSTLARGCFN